MKTRAITFLTLAAAVCLTSTAHAQRGRGGMGMGGGGYGLLMNSGVQKELKLDDAQTEKARKIVGDFMTSLREKVEQVPQEERREKAAEILRASSEELKTSLKDVLKPEQFTRLDQIVLQQQGVGAFAEPSVQSKLNLTADQKGKLVEIAAEVRTKSAELREGFANDREGTMAKLTNLRKESFDKATALLTDDQKASWKELTGEPFEVKFERRNPGN